MCIRDSHSLGAAFHSNFNGHIGHFSFVDSICPVGTSYFTPLFNKKLVSCPNFVQRVEDCPVLWEGAHQIPVAHAVQLQLRGQGQLGADAPSVLEPDLMLLPLSVHIAEPRGLRPGCLLYTSGWQTEDSGV